MHMNLWSNCDVTRWNCLEEGRLVLIGGIGAVIGNKVFQVAETWVFKIRKHNKTLQSELIAKRWTSDNQTFRSPSCDSVL